VRSVGVIGISEGNGHPFSFSSIVNGYSPEGLAASGWPGIYEYVRRRHASEFGMPGWHITHAWTQEPETTARLCAACRIQNCVDDYRDFLGKVDAVIIARDDYEHHFEMAKPFLDAGLPVFIDKPLSLEASELRSLKKYLDSGQLMSCSGMRFARELDVPRANLADFGRLKLIRGVIVRNWENYGVHLLDAMLGMAIARPISVQMIPSIHESAVVKLEGGALFEIDAMGECPPTFQIQIIGSERIATYDITDNFSMFRRMLWEFFESIRLGRPAIPSDQTLEVMKVLIAGRLSLKESREVYLNELPL
jgi:Oxidoreductase family, NAD-binding Rossmann fold